MYLLRLAIVVLAVLGIADIGAAATAPALVKKPLPPILNVTTDQLPKTPVADVQIRPGVVAPGGATIWHTHPSPTFNYVQSGTGTWEYVGRRPETRGPGQAIVERARAVVRIVNRGLTPLVLVIFQVSKPNEPLLIPARSGGSSGKNRTEHAIESRTRSSPL